MSSDEHIRRDVLQALAALPLLALVTRSGEAAAQAGGSPVKVDTQGLRGGPIEWSNDNHFRTRQYYRVYHWDPAKSAVAVAKDWVPYDVK